MTNLVNVTVIRTQARHEAKRGVGGKKNPHTSRNTSWGFPGGSVVKDCLPMQEMRVWEDPTH